MIEYTLELNKKIRVYDDLFSHQEKDKFFNFANTSYYKIGWSDTNQTDHIKYLHSEYSEEDINNLGIINSIKNTEAALELDGYKVFKCVINLSTPADTNFIHIHDNVDKVLLYYINLEWNDTFYGETLFFSENKKNIQFASPYVPGRLIAFDSRIPHSIRPQSHLASGYRFTLSLLLIK